MKINSGRKTDKKYWDEMWRRSAPVSHIKNQTGVMYYPERALYEYFSRIFSSMDDRGSTLLLEVGCANSSWMSYFYKEFGFIVEGLDYSEIGCENARKKLENDGVDGVVICADLFDPPSYMIGRYDIVVSFGVVEHFDDTEECLRALSKFLKKDGLLVTNIPNMSGLIGVVQKLINRPVYDIHNPLDKFQLCRSHEAVDGVEVLECDYFMSINFGVCNLNGIRKGSIRWLFGKIMLLFLTRLSLVVWLVEKVVALPKSRLFSPYINCVAIKR